MTDEFYEWLTEADHKYREFRNCGIDYRKGQTYYNCLPYDIAQQIVGTEYDPFFDDSIIPAFLIRVQELMAGE